MFIPFSSLQNTQIMKAIVIFGFSTLLTLCCNGQLGNLIQICDAGSTQQSVMSIDFDGDGDLDVMTTDGLTFEFNYPYSNPAYAQHFTLCENVGTNVFVHHDLLTMPTEVHWDFGDMNGDGWVDFIYEFENEIFYRENQMGFTFGADQLIYALPLTQPFPVNDPYYFIGEEDYNYWVMYIQLGDVNNDGDDELLFAADGRVYGENPQSSTMGNIYSVDYNIGGFDPPTFLFQAEWYLSGPGYNTFLDFKVLDYNNDGWNDVFYARNEGIAYDLIIHLAIDNGVFEEESSVYDNSHRYDFYDMNNDGDFEIVSSYSDGDWGFFNVGMFDFEFTHPSPQTEAPGIVATDYDNDNDGDVFIVTNTGLLSVYAQNESWIGGDWGTIPDYSIMDLNMGLGVNEFVTQLDKLDYDNDGDEDLLFIAGGRVFILPIQNNTDDYAELELNLFVDLNGNSIQDQDEVANSFATASVQLTVNGLETSTYYTYSGQFNLLLSPGNYSLEIPDNNIFYDPVSTFPLEFVIADVAEVIAIDIPFVLQGEPVNQLEIEATGWSGVCNGLGATHYVQLYNAGNTYANGTLTYVVDGLHNIISVNPIGATVTGNTILWEYDNFAPTQTQHYYIQVSSIGVEYMGQQASNAATVTIEDAASEVIFTAMDEANYIVSCAYDPNDITEHNGYTNFGYILDGDELEYTIRFQNTGNAPAAKVRIENQLSEFLRRNTMEPIAWSHDFDLMIDENNKAIFTFNDINLPYSTNNEAESHGFITYRILPVTGLSASTVINNTAEIYFDFNPAIVTNTELNTIYDCIDLQQSSVSESTVCAGEEISCSNNAIWIEDLTWSLNGNVVGNGSYMHGVNESGTLVMHVSNALCEFSQDFELTANTADASFTANGNILSANDASSYQWYLNGIEINGAIEQTYEISESGNYSVMVVDENGCDGANEQIMATYTGINEDDALHAVIYPNPAKDIITIAIDESLIGAGMKICNELGQEVWNSKRLLSVNTEVDCSAFAKGVYTITISNVRSKFVID